MRTFKQFCEVVKITTPEDLRKANIKGLSLEEFIDEGYSRIVSGRYEEPEDPLQGSKIISAKCTAMFKGKAETIPLTIVVYDPKVFKIKKARGQAEQDRKLIKVYWSKANGFGLTTSGKEYNKSQLYVTITHELIHLLDRKLAMNWDKVEKSNDFYTNPQNADALKAWKSSYHMLPDQQLAADVQKRTNMAQYQKYVSSPQERLANRDSFAYELARRLTGAAPEDQNKKDYYQDRSQAMGLDKKELLNRLRNVTYDNLEQWTGIQPASKEAIFGNPEEFKRFLSNTYRYMVKMLSERQPLQPKPQQQQVAQPPQQVAQQQPKPQSWRDRLFGWWK